MAYFDTSRTHDFFCLSIHTVRHIVDDFFYSNLHNLDTASEARTSKLSKDQKKSTYVLQYRVASFPTLSRPASNKAFSYNQYKSGTFPTSACKQRQVDKLCPLPSPILHLKHPPSLQFVTPLGVPLYPVLITLPDLTRTHPTRRFIQLLRRAAKSAKCIK